MKLINSINKILGLRHYVNPNKYKRAFLSFEYGQYNTIVNLITDFKVSVRGDVTTIHITGNRVGLIIGRAGERINRMKGFIRDVTADQSIEIDLKECLLFTNLYE